MITLSPKEQQTALLAVNTLKMEVRDTLTTAKVLLELIDQQAFSEEIEKIAEIRESVRVMAEKLRQDIITGRRNGSTE